jgi:hypothetical protein
MKLPQITSPKTVNLPSRYPMMEGFFYALYGTSFLLEIFGLQLEGKCEAKARHYRQLTNDIA